MGRGKTSFKDKLEDLQLQYPLLQDSGKADNQKYNVVYMNPLQVFGYNMGSRVLSLVSGRGSGKTQFLSMRLAHCAEIPRATGVLLTASYAQAYQRLMPNLVKGLEQGFHWVEGVHFVRGRPHKSLGFASPLVTPRTFENCICFRNGNVMLLSSLAVQGSVNGLNLSYMLLDEVRYLTPFHKIQEEALPALRGDSYSHPKWSRTQNPYFLSQTYCSDAAVTRRQAEWEDVMENEANSDEQNMKYNDEICDMLAEVEVCPELAELPKFKERLSYLRTKSRIFVRGSSLLNASLLTTEFFETMKRQMPPLLFDIQIIGKKKGLSRDGFYSSFSEELHTYIPNVEDETNIIYNKYQRKYTAIGDRGQKVEYEAPDLSVTSSINDARFDVDCHINYPLCIGIDTNKNINTMCVAQCRQYEGILSAMFLRTIYVLNEKRLEDLCYEFHSIYKYRLSQGPEDAECRKVVLFYDSTSKQGGAYSLRDGEQFRYYNVIFSTLTPLGWNVILVDMGSPMFHELKYEFVNSCLRGSERVFPRINKLNNDYLIAAIENSKLTYKFGAVKKDKSQEKRKTKDEEQQLSNAVTDVTDAFDNVLRGMCFFSDGLGRFGSCEFGFQNIPVFMPTIN